MSSYLTVIEAQTYFSTRLGTESWDEATLTDREKALAMATRCINRYNYLGEKADSSQENQFPRGEDTEVPEDIKIACSEIALSYLDGIDPGLELENLNIVHQGVDTAKTTYNRDFAAEHLANGCPSAIAWMYLKPYLRDSQNISLSRV